MRKQKSAGHSFTSLAIKRRFLNNGDEDKEKAAQKSGRLWPWKLLIERLQGRCSLRRSGRRGNG